MKKGFSLLMLMGGVLSAQVKSDTSDSRFVGCWEGSELGQYRDGQGRHWRTCRFANGLCNFEFTIVDANGVIQVKKKMGKWWVENNKFYESYDGETKVQEFEYEVIGNSIRFSGENKSGTKSGVYAFTDHRIEN